VSDGDPCRACGSTVHGYYKPSDRVCRRCRQERNRRWDTANRDRVRESRRRYEEECRADLREQAQARIEALPPEERARRKALQDDARSRMRERRVAAYLSEHGTAPPCECGCGQPVAFSSEGRPNRFLRGHFIPDRSTLIDARYKGDRIPIRQVRVHLEALRVRNGWTLTEMAARARMPLSTLRSLLRAPNRATRYGVDAAIVRRILETLAETDRLERLDTAPAAAWRETDPS
jgi:hypothetical protein